jgi:hypothetical protein
MTPVLYQAARSRAGRRHRAGELAPRPAPRGWRLRKPAVTPAGEALTHPGPGSTSSSGGAAAAITVCGESPATGQAIRPDAAARSRAPGCRASNHQKETVRS